MRINQLKMTLAFFRERMMKKYDLLEYKNVHEPVVFAGMYNDRDFTLAKNHRSHLTIVWCGSDAERYLPKNYNKIKSLTNVRHIAMSEFISTDLHKFDIDHLVLPITPTMPVKNRKTRGENIYIYVDSKRSEKYGAHLINEIRSKSGKHIIIAHKFRYTREELAEVYESCFLGLRLTQHDGLPNTVAELGLMGRKCIYNGKLPNAIPYSTVDDIVHAINKEYDHRHEDNQSIVDAMFDYLNIGDDWLFI